MSGDTPEDAGIGADGPDPGDGSPDHIRGWISPDDRLWRHPSEVTAAKGVAAVRGRRRTGPLDAADEARLQAELAKAPEGPLKDALLRLGREVIRGQG